MTLCTELVCALHVQLIEPRAIRRRSDPVSASGSASVIEFSCDIDLRIALQSTPDPTVID